MTFDQWIDLQERTGAVIECEALFRNCWNHSRNAALEEAAKLCDINSDTYKALGRPDCAQVMKGCAMGIRNMTSTLQLPAKSDTNV